MKGKLSSYSPTSSSISAGLIEFYRDENRCEEARKVILQEIEDSMNDIVTAEDYDIVE